MDGYSPETEDNGASYVPPVEQGFSADKFLQEQYAAEEDQGMPVPPNESYDDAEDVEQPRTPHESRKKKKNNVQRRIDQLTYENGAKDQRNMFLEHQLAEKEAYLAQQQARIQEYEQQIHSKDQYANESFEHNLSAQERNLKERLRQAKEDGDIDREVDIIDELAEVKSTRTTHEAWKIQEMQRKQQQLQEEEYVPHETSIRNPYPEAPIDYAFQEWKAENSWYDTNPQLRTEADSIANELSGILSFNNQAHMIGTPEFRESVTNVMRERYAMAGQQPRNAPQQEERYEEDYNDPYQVAPQRPAVAPVTRRAVGTGNMAQNYMNNRGGPRMGGALTKEEYELARYLPVRGKNEGEMDLIKRYQKAKSYPKSPLPGGSPHRLTIL